MANGRSPQAISQTRVASCLRLINLTNLVRFADILREESKPISDLSAMGLGSAVQLLSQTGASPNRKGQPKRAGFLSKLLGSHRRDSSERCLAHKPLNLNTHHRRPLDQAAAAAAQLDKVL